MPLFQAQIQGAAQHDPVFLGMTKSMGPSRVPCNSTTTIAFFDLCHVCYHCISIIDMAVDIQLVMCPTSAGKSRVMLFNVFESFLPPVNATVDEIAKKPFKERLASLSPKIVICDHHPSLWSSLPCQVPDMCYTCNSCAFHLSKHHSPVPSIDPCITVLTFVSMATLSCALLTGNELTDTTIVLAPVPELLVTTIMTFLVKTIVYVLILITTHSSIRVGGILVRQVVLRVFII